MIIQVGIPSYSGKLFPETRDTIARLSSYRSDEVSFNVFVVPQCSTAEGRNLSVSLGNRKKKQLFNFDYFLSMDADISFDVAHVLMLIDRGVDIVSAAYHKRSASGGALTPKLVAAHWKTPGLAFKEDYIGDDARGLLPVSMVGLGCCLINSSVFEEMTYPYFRNNVVEEGEYSGLAGEDLSFCMDAAAAGYTIYLDADVRVAHNCGNEER